MHDLYYILLQNATTKVNVEAEVIFVSEKIFFLRFIKIVVHFVLSCYKFCTKWVIYFMDQ